MDRQAPVRVRDVMSQPIESIGPEATVQAAARRMIDRSVTALLVTASSTGIITSTDVLRVVAEGGDPAALEVADVMTAPVETVTPDLRLEEAAAMMTTFDIKHLPVVDDDFVGMVSSMDVTAHRT